MGTNTHIIRPKNNAISDNALWRSFVRGVVTGYEVSDDKAFQSSYAQRDNSGLTFGKMQNDVAANRFARAAFEKILRDQASAVGLDPKKISDIVTEAAKPGVSRSVFEEVTISAVNLRKG